MEKRLLVTGDRNWSDREIIHQMLARCKNEGFDTLIEGEARGADTIAREEAEKLGYTIAESSPGVKGFPANWGKYHKAAGPIRNIQMLKEGKPDLVLGFHHDIANSKGTKHMLKECKTAGIFGQLVVDKFTVVNLSSITL